MNSKLLLAVLVLLGPLGTVSAQNLVLDYLDGTVEVRVKGDTWKLLEVGDVLPLDSVVRISDNGVAELSSGPQKIHLGKDGTFQLSVAMAQSQKKGSGNLLGLTNKQVGMLLGVGNPAGLNVANMGARGAAQGESDGMAWASEDADAALDSDPVAAVQEQIDAQDWPAALDTTIRALARHPEVSQVLLFDKALILAQLGRSAGAVKALREANVQQGQAHYWEAALLLGTQGLETEDYDLVVSTTASALLLNPEKGVSQNLLLAQALAWRAQGDETKAKNLLSQVVAIESTSGAGQEAQRLLGK